MNLAVYNTLTKKRETFEPIEPNKITMYACGVTVYDVCHIGHAMQAIIYDVIRNYFRMLGYEVTYVRNYTDVDDKIIERAKELDVCPLEHSRRMIECSRKDLATVGVKPADIEPKVSDHIADIIDLIQSLVDKGTAYPSGGDVYFKVGAFETYGKLSNRSPDDMLSGARVEANPNKRNPLDFALWKGAKEGEISWDSPWGKGRPGWHIECSAMSMRYLGRTFDIHGGGKDLIFPHHENEIAQSEAASKRPYARYWIHNGLVTVGGRKMSKSFNNFMSIRDAIESYYPETIRFTILSHHYASNIDFSEKSFHDAYHRLMYFYNTLKRLEGLRADYPDPSPDCPGIEPPDVKDAFTKAMNDDFNTAAAIREIGVAFKFINDLLAAKKPKLKQKVGLLLGVADALAPCLEVLGLLTTPPTEALAGLQRHLIRDKGIDKTEIERKIEARNAARAAKDYAESDRIRDELQAMGVAVMDTPAGTEWQVLP